MRMLCHEQRVENTLYFLAESAWSAADLTTLGENMIAWWTAEMAPNFSEDLALHEVYLTSLQSSTSPAVTVVPEENILGEVGEPADANNVSLCVSFRTNIRGRSFRGRNYCVGLPKASVVSSRVSPGLVANIVAAYDVLRTATPAPASLWVAVSRFSGVDVDGDPIPRVTGLHTEISAVLAVDNVVDSQRRRLPTRGQ